MNEWPDLTADHILAIVVAIAVAWIIVPFILFGTNSRLSDLRRDTMYALGVVTKKQIQIEKTLRELIEIQRRAHNIPDPEKTQEVDDFLKSTGGNDVEPRL